MGFLDAISQVGALEKKEGIEAYLKYPLEGEGRVIRVFLNVDNPNAEVLKVLGKQNRLSGLNRSRNGIKVFV